jgi:hypothetical protein
MLLTSFSDLFRLTKKESGNSVRGEGVVNKRSIRFRLGQKKRR